MNFCKGVENWFYCLRCPYLCSSQCPIESDDPLRLLSRFIKKDEATVEEEKGKVLR